MYPLPLAKANCGPTRSLIRVKWVLGECSELISEGSLLIDSAGGSKRFWNGRQFLNIGTFFRQWHWNCIMNCSRGKHLFMCFKTDWSRISIRQ
uniref:Uncharacterized protein n=1 Tax=Physcomitrium patens TaxID=3218 RepID=A0A2K1IE04_PHYPA|nr:hypothetical protein PHYPA_029656 [Physcomitrium patens]